MRKTNPGWGLGTSTIERLHVTSLPSRLRRKTEKFLSQRDRSFYGNLRETSDILIMLLICVESDKIPLLHKLKQLYKRLPVGFLITCCTSHTPRWRFISGIRNYDHETKSLRPKGASAATVPTEVPLLDSERVWSIPIAACGYSRSAA